MWIWMHAVQRNAVRFDFADITCSMDSVFNLKQQFLWSILSEGPSLKSVCLDTFFCINGKKNNNKKNPKHLFETLGAIKFTFGFYSSQ